jgi:hypothetical protein
MSGDGWYNQFRPTTPIMPSFSDINFTTSLLTLKNKPLLGQLFYTSQLLHITRGTNLDYQTPNHLQWFAVYLA